MLRKLVLTSILLMVCHHAGAAAPEDHLVLYLPFDEGSGTVSTDPISGAQATLTGAFDWTAGKLGQAVAFTGGLATADDSDRLNLTFITAMAWVNPTTITANTAPNHHTDLDPIYEKRGSGDDSIVLGLTGGDGVHFYVDVGGDRNLSVPDAGVQTDEWQHVAGTYDGAMSRAFLNGELIGEMAVQNPIITNTNPATVGGRTFRGAVDELHVYDRALTQEEIARIMQGDPTVATSPQPSTEATDTQYDTILSWIPSKYAVAHTVYLGTSIDQVNDATEANPMDVLVSAGQTDITYDPGILDFNQTYYWRVDEVNGAPDHTVFKGDIWSFTVEPLAVTIDNITATASGANPGMEPENTVNGSGLNALGQHTTIPEAMWLAPGPNPWIQYSFDKAYTLHEMRVWNSNQAIESFIGFGMKGAVVETSIDGENWTTVVETIEFAQAPGQSTYTGNTVVDLSGVKAQSLRITGQSAHGFTGQMGLSEVQFTAIPVNPRELSPATDTNTDGLDVTLSWRPGRHTADTQVLLDTDYAAVADGSAIVETTSDKSIDLSDLDYARTYFWQVINRAEDGTPYPSDILSFNTVQRGTIDDFESYSGDEGAEIFMTWWDGFGGDDSLGGSTTGHIDAPFVETATVNNGKNAMPVFYDNDGGFLNIDAATGSPTFSAVVREFDTNLDLTQGNADLISVSFRGNAPGFAEDDNGNITMSAAGTDIYNNDDQFRYAYKTLSGDGSITARVTRIDATHPWAKAGVMIRASSVGDAIHGTMILSPVNGMQFLYRLLQAGPTAGAIQPTGQRDVAPHWVRVTRTGNTVTAAVSADGVTWDGYTTAPEESTMELPLPATVMIGLAVTSHASGVTTMAEFSDVSFTGNATGAWTVEAIGVDMPGNDGQDPLYFELADSSGKTARVVHPDPGAVQSAQWQDWIIPLSAFDGINLSRIRSILIGVGYPNGAQSGTEGILYLDDLEMGASPQ